MSWKYECPACKEETERDDRGQCIPCNKLFVKWIRQKGDTTGRLWIPQTLQEVKERAMKSGRAFKRIFG